jgi:hypothetical protein
MHECDRRLPAATPSIALAIPHPLSILACACAALSSAGALDAMRAIVFVEPTRGLAATEFESHPHPLKSLTRRGYRVASEDGDWLLYMHCLGLHGDA